MKKIYYIIIIIFLFTLSLMYGEKLATLEEVGNPEMIEITDHYFYVVEGATIYTYNLQDFSFMKKFGKRGEGPGELKTIPSITNYIVPLPETILVVSMDKAIIFSQAGELIKEFKVPLMTNYLYQVDNNYLGMKFKQGADPKPDMDVILFDGKMKEIKKIFSQKLAGGRNLLNLTFDGINLTVYKDRLYIEESANGFIISIYDLKGNPLYKINKEYKKIAFTDKHKEEAINIIKAEPQIKAVGWENLKNILKIIHSEYLPPIQDMMIDSDLIYIKTSEKKGEKDKYIMMDLRGNSEKTVYLPRVMESRLGNKVLGRPARFYKIFKGKFYYIKENEDEETWEVHAEKIKL